MKKTLSTLFLFFFIAQLVSGQTATRYFKYDNAGNRVWRKDHLGVDPGGCPNSLDGYIKLGEYNDHAYFLSDNMEKWEDAKLLAENDGGYLVTINDQAENDWIKSLLGNNMVFIGYNDASPEGTMQWANNEPVTLDLGYDNNPTNDYGLMNFWAGTWQLVGPWQAKKYILEMDCGSGTEPTGSLAITCPADINVTTPTSSAVVTWNDATATTTCSVNTNVTVTQTVGSASGSSFPIGATTITYQATDNCNNTETCSFIINVTATQGGGCGAIAGYTKLGEFGGHGYYLSDASVSWTAANSLAQNDGGYLATMNTQAENDFLKSNLGNNMVFIGYNDGIIEGTMQWANNEPVTLDLSYSNSDENDYAVMNFWAGTWQLVNQWVNKKYILEKDCGPVPPAAPQESKKTLEMATMILYPNPTDGVFTIHNKGEIAIDAMVHFYNDVGSLVYSRNLGDGRFDISNFASGIYSLVVMDGAQVYKAKIAKAN